MPRGKKRNERQAIAAEIVTLLQEIGGPEAVTRFADLLRKYHAVKQIEPAITLQEFSLMRELEAFWQSKKPLSTTSEASFDRFDYPTPPGFE